MHLSRRRLLQAATAISMLGPGLLAAQERTAFEWPSFRGPRGRGVADGFSLPQNWNADPETGELLNVSWKVSVPGLGHGSPILWGQKIFLATAISKLGTAPLSLGPSGAPTAADDQGEQDWVVLCYDAGSGHELWRQTAHAGQPRASRHAKATHANTTLATDGDNLVAFLGSEGLYNFDLQGNLRWKRDLGVINISKYGIGWGYASSPAIWEDRLVLLCDDPEKPFLICLDLNNGDEIWRVSREGVSERSWATPMIHTAAENRQVVINGWPWIVSYDLDQGTELWRVKGGGDNPVPTPFVANDLIYVTNAHGGPSPIFAIHPSAKGEIVVDDEASPAPALAWSQIRGGSYMSTPVVYGDYIYFGNTNGVLRCFHATSGEKVYEERLDADAAIYASLVAGDGKIFCAAENGTVFVVRAGPDFDLLARNQLGDPCFATPIISNGQIYFRTTRHLLVIGNS